MENLNILEKLENEIFNHRKTNRGKRPKEIQISSKGIYEMKKTDLFQKDGGYTKPIGYAIYKLLGTVI